MKAFKEHSAANNGNCSMRKIHEQVIEVTAPIEEDKVILVPGCYDYLPCVSQDSPERLQMTSFRQDAYLNIYEKSEEIKNQIDKFLDNKAVYRRLNIIYKMGVLLYGEPGDGKTSFIRNLVNTHPRFKDAIVITIYSSFPSRAFLRALNKSTPDTLKVFIFEEFTEFTARPSDMEFILTFLDGEISVDNSMTFATTNYPQDLPQNIVSRPSRFDKLYRISSPNESERKKLIQYFHGSEPSTFALNEMAGKSSAFIKEICLNALVNNIDLEESITHVKNTFDVVKRDFKTNKFGL